MYGTIAHMRFKAENKQALVDNLTSQTRVDVPGFVSARLLFPDDRPGEAYLAAVFEDRDSYMKNADSPEQHDRYVQMRALLDADPEWTDGEWVSGD